MECSVYEEIPVEEAFSGNTGQFTHAAHVMVYAEWPGALFGKYPFKYAVMMQIRFDGTLGFPGGMVDKGETPEEAVSRELAEEVGGEAISIERSDHVITCISNTTKFCLHFYAKAISTAAFRRLEEGCVLAKDWSTEVLGVTRCPLYTLPNGLGFPAFLNNSFIGNSRDQLLITLERRGMLTPEEIQLAKDTRHKVNPIVSKDEVGYDL